MILCALIAAKFKQGGTKRFAFARRRRYSPSNRPAVHAQDLTVSGTVFFKKGRRRQGLSEKPAQVERWLDFRAPETMPRWPVQFQRSIGKLIDASC